MPNNDTFIPGKGLHIRNGKVIGGAGGGISELPIASPDTLGGIKVGDNLSIEADGTLNAEAAESELNAFTVETSSWAATTSSDLSTLSSWLTAQGLTLAYTLEDIPYTAFIESDLFNNDTIADVDFPNISDSQLENSALIVMIMARADGLYLYASDMPTDALTFRVISAVRNVPENDTPVASNVSYDNTESELTATNVQDAIDEVNSKISSSVQSTYTVAVADWIDNTDSDIDTTLYTKKAIITATGITGTIPFSWHMNGAGIIPSESELENINLILEAVADTNSITLYATDAPTNALTLEVVGGK